MKYEVNNPISMQSNCFWGDNAISGFQFRADFGSQTYIGIRMQKIQFDSSV